MSSGAGSPNSSCTAMSGGLKPDNHRQACPNSSASDSSPRAAMNAGPKPNGCGFQMPLHYPRYKKSDYEKMPEWQLERLLNEYGLPAVGDLHQKRKFAMGAFLWPDQL